MRSDHSLRRSTQIILIVTAFLTGILTGNFGWQTPLYAWPLLALGLTFTLLKGKSYIIWILVLTTVALGAHTSLPYWLQDALAAVGLSHLVTVSGYSLTVITDWAKRLLGRGSGFRATILPLWLIAGFVVLTGAPASIVRATVMSALVLIVGYYGHKLPLVTAIALAAGLTAAFNPNYLLSDIGWQLSFLALLGIALITPALQARWWLGPKWLGELLSVSLGAQLATAPFIAYKFGLVSLAAPLANLLILPLVPILMLAGLVAGLGALILPGLGAFLGIPVGLALQYLIDFITWLFHQTGSNLAINLPLIGTLTLYLILAGWTLLIRRSVASNLEPKH